MCNSRCVPHTYILIAFQREQVSTLSHSMVFYILINNAKQGPFSIEELENKDITVNTMVWAVGFSNWKPAKEVPELSNLLADLPPEPPTASTNFMPKTWLVESILVTCFCCLPFGIMGIINAVKIETLYNNRQYEQALIYSRQAKKWTLWGFFIMLAFWVLYLLGIGIFALIAANS